MLTGQQRLGVVQGSLGSVSAGVSVDRGRDGVGKERKKWRGNEGPGVEFPLEGRLVLTRTLCSLALRSLASPCLDWEWSGVGLGLLCVERAGELEHLQRERCGSWSGRRERKAGVGVGEGLGEF